ncbi:hypothetical protein Hanom_Chr15g01362221 [Helianthus anomalus]
MNICLRASKRQVWGCDGLVKFHSLMVLISVNYTKLLSRIHYFDMVGGLQALTGLRCILEIY